MFCSKCGIELPTGVKFCPKCGTKVADGIEENKNEDSKVEYNRTGLKLIPAVCTNCNAPLTLPPDSKSYICPHCNTEFLVDEAINNFNISNMKGDVHIEHATVNVANDLEKMNRRCCPECGSSNIAKLSMVYKSGVMDLSAHASSDSIFDSRGADIKGTYKSKLAESVAPPEPREYMPTWKTVLFVIFGLPYIISFLISPTLVSTVISAIAILLLLWSFKSVYTYNNTVYPEMLKNWNIAWCCKSCGFIFRIANSDKYDY